MTKTIEEVITTRLNTHPATSALLDGRVYILTAPEHAQEPLVVFRRVSTLYYPSHDTQSQELRTQRFQFDIYASGVLETLQVVEALREALQGYRDIIDGKQVNCIPAGEYHLDDPDRNLKKIAVDYQINYGE